MIVKEDSLTHYGRKGMKWGEHIFGKDGEASYVKRSSDRFDRLSNIESKRNQLSRSRHKSEKSLNPFSWAKRKNSKKFKRNLEEDKRLFDEWVKESKDFQKEINTLYKSSNTKKGKQLVAAALSQYGHDDRRDSIKNFNRYFKNERRSNRRGG